MKQVFMANRKVGLKMKKGIHKEFKDTKFICACGETFTLKSNKDEMHIDVCSKCHPAYTGKQNATTVKGNVDKFNKKYGIKKA